VRRFRPAIVVATDAGRAVLCEPMPATEGIRAAAGRNTMCGLGIGAAGGKWNNPEDVKGVHIRGQAFLKRRPSGLQH